MDPTAHKIINRLNATGFGPLSHTVVVPYRPFCRNLKQYVMLLRIINISNMIAKSLTLRKGKNPVLPFPGK